LELHLQLDAKLRALESVLRCGQDASQLFKYDRKDRVHTSVQTELNIEEIYIKEHQNELFSNELKLTKLRDKEKLVARENDLIRREQDL
jgi:hypothetical protein